MNKLTALVILCTTITSLSLPLILFPTPVNAPTNPNKPETNRGVHTIFMGDTGSGNENQYTVAGAIADFCQEVTCKQAVILGDVIYEKGVKGMNDSQFKTKFEQPYQKLNFPFLIAFGNHDYLGCENCYLQYESSKWYMPASYYSYELSENVKVFIIDTEAFNAKQMTWLKNALDESTTKWEIVAGHRPILTYEQNHAGEDWVGRNELKEIICREAAVYIAGHSHSMEDNGILSGCNVRQLISGTGGATTRKVRAGERNLFASSKYGFTALHEEKDDLVWEFLSSEGKLLHEVKLVGSQ